MLKTAISIPFVHRVHLDISGVDGGSNGGERGRLGGRFIIHYERCITLPTLSLRMSWHMSNVHNQDLMDTCTGMNVEFEDALTLGLLLYRLSHIVLGVLFKQKAVLVANQTGTT